MQMPGLTDVWLLLPVASGSSRRGLSRERVVLTTGLLRNPTAAGRRITVSSTPRVGRPEVPTRSVVVAGAADKLDLGIPIAPRRARRPRRAPLLCPWGQLPKERALMETQLADRKSTRLNSSHLGI